MKKLLIFLCIVLSTNLNARLRYDYSKCFYYSDNAPKNVDSAEYNRLAHHVGIFLLKNKNDKNAFIELIASLKLIGTPAALILIDDVKTLIEETIEVLIN